MQKAGSNRGHHCHSATQIMPFALLVTLACQVASASAQQHPNPFEGTWVVAFEKNGKSLSKKRVDLNGSGGWFYDVQKHYAGDPKGVCRNLRAPIEDVVFTETSLRFVVARQKVVSGCSDLRFALERTPQGLVGTMTGEEDGDERASRQVSLFK